METDRDRVTTPKIAGAVVHPGIGIARVGNSPDQFFIGPELPGVVPDPGTHYKDQKGAFKRQAARFRIYGVDVHGTPVKELTADNAEITWNVHLANKKASWYQFHMALDIPESLTQKGPGRRNPTVKSTDRRRLEIDPGQKSISGRNKSGAAYRFDSGSFMGRRVPLGELRTDAFGRVLVLGGLGNSGTTKKNNPAVTFANNDGWYDDISDGSVAAKVVFQGQSLPVTRGWVIVAPPAFAPGLEAIVTMYDIAYQAYLDANPCLPPRTVSFTRDIYPILQRFDGFQWLNEGFYEAFGWQGQTPLLDPARLARYASNKPATDGDRKQVFLHFRDPSYMTVDAYAWPQMYGDSVDQAPTHHPRQYLAVTQEQYRCLCEWSKGNFVADWHPGVQPPKQLEGLPVAEQPSALDGAALRACSGGAFHPGMEATWPMRRQSMYQGLCRLRMRKASDPPEMDYGDVLSVTRALGPDGPLHMTGPGDITRWMAVPWQTDTSSCGSAYPKTAPTPYPFPDLPTFWPAGAPNKIFTEAAYKKVMDGHQSRDTRTKAFKQRVAWTRQLPSDPKQYVKRINLFVKVWWLFGIIRKVAGPTDPAFPKSMYVETEVITPKHSGFPDEARGVWRDGPDEEFLSTPSQPLMTDWRSHL
jgi:hypothetical protein